MKKKAGLLFLILALAFTCIPYNLRVYADSTESEAQTQGQTENSQDAVSTQDNKESTADDASSAADEETDTAATESSEPVDDEPEEANSFVSNSDDAVTDHKPTEEDTLPTVQKVTENRPAPDTSSDDHDRNDSADSDQDTSDRVEYTTSDDSSRRVQNAIRKVQPAQPHLTVQFFVQGASEDKPFAEQILLDGQNLQYPDITGLNDYKTKSLKEYVDKDGKKFDQFNQPVSVQETSTLKLYAVFDESIYHITYHDTNGNVALIDEWEEGYTIRADYPAIYIHDGYACKGWSEQKDSISPQYTTGSQLSLTKDIDLWPVIGDGRYIHFNSDGGTAVESEFINLGESPKEPDPAPTKSGYAFEGWYDTDGNKVDFSRIVMTKDTPADGITVTAHWRPEVTSYKVVVWLENASYSDASSKYSYGTTFEKRGISGGSVSFSDEGNDSDNDENRDEMKDVLYHHGAPVKLYFLESAPTKKAVDQINQNWGIAGDGSTTLNVYYRRFCWRVGVVDTLRNKKFKSFSGRWGENVAEAAKRNGVSIDEETLKHEGYQVNIQGSYFTGTSDDALAAEDLFDPSTCYEESKIVCNDGDNIDFYVLNGYSHEGNLFVRQYYYETIDSAKNNPNPEEGKGYKNTDLSRKNNNYTLDHVAIIDRPKYTETDGLREGSQTGFEAYEWRIDQVDTTDPYNVNGAYTVYRYGHTFPLMTYNAFRVRDTYPGYIYRIFQKRLKYSLILDANNGTDVIKISDIPYEDKLSNYEDQFPKLTEKKDKDGSRWSFAGWYDNASCSGDPVDLHSLKMPAGNMTLYVKWEPLMIHVTFDAANGRLSEDGAKTKTISIRYGSVPDKPDDPILPDGASSFICWAKDKVNGTYYGFDTPLYGDRTLYATYHYENPLSVRYYLGSKDGSGLQGSGKVPYDDEKYLWGSSAKVLGSNSILPPKGYYFVGWRNSYDGNLYWPGNVLQVLENIELTAEYQKLGYTSLFYNTNGGTGILSDLEGTVTATLHTPDYGENEITNIENNASVTLSHGTGITREGYVLKGWNTDQEKALQGKVEFNFGENVMVDDMDGDSNILYAVWESTGSSEIVKPDTPSNNSSDEVQPTPSSTQEHKHHHHGSGSSSASSASGSTGSTVIAQTAQSTNAPIVMLPENTPYTPGSAGSAASTPAVGGARAESAKTSSGSKKPSTGDESMMAVWGFLAIVSVAGLILTFRRRRNSQR